MAKREIFEKVIRLADELSKIHFTSRIFDSVESKDKESFYKLIDSLKIQNKNLYQEIINLGEEIKSLIKSNNKDECSIFSDKNKLEKGIHLFDTNIYNSLSLVIISFVGKFEIGYLFENWKYSNCRYIFAEDIGKYTYLSRFVLNEGYHKVFKKYPDLCDLLLDIFDGKFE